MPSGPEIRPTRDMVREALFDMLGPRIGGCLFLDLFAGTGASGIEALSRGASRATFVDRSRFCVEAIHKNLAKTRLEEHARVIKADAFKFLQKARPEEGIFDIIFADPPYEERSGGAGSGSLAKRTLQLISAANILARGALVIIEHSSRRELPSQEGVLSLWKDGHYGSSRISIYRTA